MNSNRGTSYKEVEAEQRALCANYGASFQPSAPGTKVGIALETLTQLPINGLRHPPEGDTNGWYIWCGKELSSSADFFKPLHVEHLVIRLPHILKFLGLAPGYRFLITGDYVDVWFDQTLLS
jgi:hypothetical protein